MGLRQADEPARFQKSLKKLQLLAEALQACVQTQGGRFHACKAKHFGECKMCCLHHCHDKELLPQGGRGMKKFIENAIRKKTFQSQNPESSQFGLD